MATKARAFQEACRFRSQDQLQQTRAFLPIAYRSGLLLLSDSSKTSCRIRLPRRIQSRSASTNSGPSRRAITVTTDDGRYDSKELSTGEKAARGTQQTFNFLLVSLGLVGTVRKRNLTCAEQDARIYKHANTAILC